MGDAEIIAERFDPLGEFSHDSAIKMQAFIAFAARKFCSINKKHKNMFLNLRTSEIFLIFARKW